MCVLRNYLEFRKYAELILYSAFLAFPTKTAFTEIISIPRYDNHGCLMDTLDKDDCKPSY